VNDNLGIDVHGIEDLNGDGVADVAASTERRNSSEGEVILFSGADGTVLRRLTDASTMLDERLGNAIDVVPDVDGDGLDDILAGARTPRSAASQTAAAHSCSPPEAARSSRPGARAPGRGGQFGWAVAGIGDVTRDGVPEFVTGAPTTAPRRPRSADRSPSSRSRACATPTAGRRFKGIATTPTLPMERPLRGTRGAIPLGLGPPRVDGAVRSRRHGRCHLRHAAPGSAAGFGSAACLETAEATPRRRIRSCPAGVRRSSIWSGRSPVRRGRTGTWGALQWPREAAGCP